MKLGSVIVLYNRPIRKYAGVKATLASQVIEVREREFSIDSIWTTNCHEVLLDQYCVIYSGFPETAKIWCIGRLKCQPMHLMKQFHCSYLFDHFVSSTILNFVSLSLYTFCGFPCLAMNLLMIDTKPWVVKLLIKFKYISFILKQINKHI